MQCTRLHWNMNHEGERETDKAAVEKGYQVANLESLYYFCNLFVVLKFFKIKSLKEDHKKLFAALEKAAKIPDATPEQENWAHHPMLRVTCNRQPRAPQGGRALGSQRTAP